MLLANESWGRGLEKGMHCSHLSKMNQKATERSEFYRHTLTMHDDSFMAMSTLQGHYAIFMTACSCTFSQVDRLRELLRPWLETRSCRLIVVPWYTPCKRHSNEGIIVCRDFQGRPVWTVPIQHSITIHDSPERIVVKVPNSSRPIPILPARLQ